MPRSESQTLTFSATCDRVYIALRNLQEGKEMNRIKTLDTRDLCESAVTGGCGECQTSCQSACKTSCGVANQSCENQKK